MSRNEGIELLRAAYAADLESLETPQEQHAYCEGVIEAARAMKKEV